MTHTHTHTHTHTRLTTLCPGLPGEPVPERQNQCGFHWSKRYWVAVASGISKSHFYRAMLSSAVLAMGLCLSVSVRLSQVGVLSKGLVFGMCASFHPSYVHCVKRKFGYLQNKGASLWNFFLNSGLRKFRHGISIVETCYQRSSRKVDAQSVINWAV